MAGNVYFIKSMNELCFDWWELALGGVRGAKWHSVDIVSPSSSSDVVIISSVVDNSFDGMLDIFSLFIWFCRFTFQVK